MTRTSSETDFFRDMFLFTEVAKRRSFSQTATALQVSLSLLSRRIAALEKRLGLQLLKRSTRTVELTELGAHYFNRCHSLVAEALRVHEEVQGMARAPRGHLRIFLPVDCAALMGPLLTEFIEIHPEISIDCDAQRHDDLLNGQLDLVIRLGIQPDSTLVSHPLASLKSHLYAAPDYLKRRGAPRHPRGLTEHECLRLIDSRRDGSWTLSNGDERLDVPIRGRLVLSSLEAINRLVCCGMGIGLLADVIARDSVQAGRMVPILKAWSAAPIPVHAVTATRLLPAKTQVFIDFLRARLAQAS